MADMRQSYQVGSEASEVRGATKVPFKKWTTPSGSEIRTALRMAGWSEEQLAETVGINSRTVRRWVEEDADIRYAVWAVLCVAAGWGRIWEEI